MAENTCVKDEKVGIVGSGVIGVNWAMLFAAAGYSVKIYDISEDQLKTALVSIETKLKDIESKEMLRGSLSVDQQRQRISATTSLKECLTGAKFIQECVPERVDLKKKVFTEMDGLVDNNDVVLSSSTSAIPASSFSENLKHRGQVIVSHPVNPPVFLPLTEVVPTSWTDPKVTEVTMAIMKEIGQVPVLLKKEVRGFVLNRLQYALLMEAWRLIQDGVISPDDMDKVMTDGLGARYAFIGPLETCHLNADGFQDYCKRYGQGIYDTCETFGPLPKMEGETAGKIAANLEEKIPLDKLAERKAWRDERLSALALLKKKMDAKKE